MSASTASAAAAIPAAPKPRPYGRYLTSILHTRFVHAVLLALLNSFLLAFWTGRDYFWSWFPIGPAGFKAALFTMSSLFVFILQLATMTAGRRIFPSPTSIFRSIFFATSSYQTLFWYIVSAWWFCEAYIWAVSDDYSMGWVIRVDNSTRLNERPIYLRFFFTVIAIVQSGLHVLYGQSFLHIPVSRPPSPQSADHQTHPMDTIQGQLQKKLPMIGMRSLLASGLSTIVAPFIYKAFFRASFWHMHLAFAKLFFNLPSDDANPPETYFIGIILGWAFVVGTALSFTWEVAAHSLLIYLKQAPLKNGLPLSAASKDPNGSLLSGLVAKRSVVKTFAFWELSLIAQKYPDRRKAIFADFERPNGPMWTLMLKAALAVVSAIDSRIEASNPALPQPIQPTNPPQIDNLPRIAKGASEKPVFAPVPPPSTRTGKFESFFAQTNKAIGQSPHPWSPPIKETQQKMLEYARPAVNSGSNDLRDGITKVVQRSPVRGLFGTNLARKISTVVLGHPAGNAAIIVDAIEAITKMLVASLNEDDFGKAVQTVPESVKQFSRSIMLIEGHASAKMQSMTDQDEKELEEVLVIVSRLKAGLRELLTAFQVFLNDAGLGIKDLNEARRASEDRPLLPKRQPQQQQKTLQLSGERTEMEEVKQPPQRQLGSRNDDRHTDNDSRDQRARETAQSLKRIESQPRRQRITSGERNVFGARDFNSAPKRYSREVETVR